LDLPDEVWQRLRYEADHELRAALICLLTAALADKGTAAIIGEAEGGWFWLPPWSVWQPWATDGLENVAKKMALKVTTSLDPFVVGSLNLPEAVMNRATENALNGPAFRPGSQTLTQI
jgi:hypothetical protein